MITLSEVTNRSVLNWCNACDKMEVPLTKRLFKLGYGGTGRSVTNVFLCETCLGELRSLISKRLVSHYEPLHEFSESDYFMYAGVNADHPKIALFEFRGQEDPAARYPAALVLDDDYLEISVRDLPTTSCLLLFRSFDSVHKAERFAEAILSLANESDRGLNMVDCREVFSLRLRTQYASSKD